jgi:hypothetical protein
MNKQTILNNITEDWKQKAHYKVTRLEDGNIKECINIFLRIF